jgi:hypothetical protein
MCSCGKKRERWIVTLPGGLKVSKSSESQANAFAAKHPGAIVQKG